MESKHQTQNIKSKHQKPFVYWVCLLSLLSMLIAFDVHDSIGWQHWKKISSLKGRQTKVMFFLMEYVQGGDINAYYIY